MGNVEVAIVQLKILNVDKTASKWLLEVERQ